MSSRKTLQYGRFGVQYRRTCGSNNSYTFVSRCIVTIEAIRDNLLLWLSATNLISKIPLSSSLILPTETAYPLPVSLSKRGCGLSASSITTIACSGADGHPIFCASETYSLIACLTCSALGGGLF